MLNAMAIALSGVGYSSIVLALNGFSDVAVSAVVSGGGRTIRSRRPHPGPLILPRKPEIEVLDEDDDVILICVATGQF